MPSWLVDDPTNVLLVLGLVAAGLGIVWWRTRQRAYVIGLLIVGAIIVAVLSLKFLVPTDFKQIVRKTREMADAVADRDVNRIFTHMSDQFMLQDNVKKADFRQRVEGYIKRGDVTGVEVWDFEAVEISRPKRTAVVIFRTKGKGPAFGGFGNFNCKATFVLDSDQEWRMKDFRLYWPHVDPRVGEELQYRF